MSIAYHKSKLAEAIKNAAAEFIVREAGPLSLITVIRVDLSEKNENAIVYISVLPDNQQNAATDFLNRKRGEFGKFLLDKAKIGRLPHFTFEIDKGEKIRQVLETL